MIFNNSDGSSGSWISSVISIGEALLDSGVDSLKETLRCLSSSLSWLRDSPKRHFLQRSASIVLSVVGWRL